MDKIEMAVKVEASGRYALGMPPICKKCELRHHTPKLCGQKQVLELNFLAKKIYR